MKYFLAIFSGAIFFVLIQFGDCAPSISSITSRRRTISSINSDQTSEDSRSTKSDMTTSRDLDNQANLFNNHIKPDLSITNGKSYFYDDDAFNDNFRINAVYSDIYHVLDDNTVGNKRLYEEVRKELEDLKKSLSGYFKIIQKNIVDQRVKELNNKKDEFLMINIEEVSYETFEQVLDAWNNILRLRVPSHKEKLNSIRAKNYCAFLIELRKDITETMNDPAKGKYGDDEFKAFIDKFAATLGQVHKFALPKRPAH